MPAERACTRAPTAGSTWLPKRSGFPTDSGGNTAKVMSLAIDPNNTAVVWAGTQNEGLVKSTNGGDSWGLKGFVDVPDVDGIAVKPGDSNTILVGTGDYRGSGGTTGEIYKSTDGGQSWQLKSRLGHGHGLRVRSQEFQLDLHRHELSAERTARAKPARGSCAGSTAANTGPTTVPGSVATGRSSRWRSARRIHLCSWPARWRRATGRAAPAPEARLPAADDALVVRCRRITVRLHLGASK